LAFRSTPAPRTVKVPSSYDVLPGVVIATTLHLDGARRRNPTRQQWQDGGRTVLALTTRDENETGRAAVREVDATGPLTLGVTVHRTDARFWYAADGLRRPIGPPLDFTRLSDDHGTRLRFTGAMAAIHAVDLVDASFTADFTDFRGTCTTG
jgi:xylan 1,4-beta-xylosidase